MIIEYVALDANGDVDKVLDVVEFPEPGAAPLYETEMATGVVEAALRRHGDPEAALAELADGWSNGYVATRERT